MIIVSKRSRFVWVGLVVSICLWLTRFVVVDYQLGFTLAVAAFAYILSVWSLFEDLKGVEWLTLTTLPTMFTLGAALFANFLPNSVPRLLGKQFEVETAMLFSGLLRLLYFVFVAIGLYGILLIENIFSVASVRTIQLFRAARSVNFILTLLTALFFYTTIFGLKLEFYWVGLLTFLITYVLSFPCLWSVDLKREETARLRYLSFLVALVALLIGISLSFWPIKSFMGGLMLTSVLYSQLGIVEQRLTSRVYLDGVMGYVMTVVIIMIVGFISTSWTGS